jgi:hypothetical protein
MRKYLAGCLLLCIVGTNVRADEPLAPPEVLTVCSLTKQFCAVSDPTESITRFSSQRSHKTLWSIPGWHPWLFVSDDGESVVVGYDGMNLVPVDVALTEPVLFFYLRGTLVRTVTLGELYQRKSQLRRTVSHYAWVRDLGYNKANQLVVELVDGKRVAFSATTGQVQRVIPDGT